MIKSSPEKYPTSMNPDAALKISTQEIIDSNTLFNGKKEISIKHQGAIYHLKITRQGKLILNK